MLGHSSQMAALSERAAGALGFGPEAPTELRRAALLHDLGRVAVSNRIWEKPAALSTTEWEQVRLHPYQSERILSRVLARLARTAGMHHERQDGSGYHRAPQARSARGGPGSGRRGRLPGHAPRTAPTAQGWRPRPHRRRWRSRHGRAAWTPRVSAR
jgi:HD domain-containing protein